jgi:hypothetical protein
LKKVASILLTLLVLFVPAISEATAQTSNLVYTIGSQVYLNQFDQSSIMVTMIINNTGSVASLPESLSLAFPSYYYGGLMSYNYSGATFGVSFYNSSTYFNSTLPSIPAGGGIEVQLGMNVWGLVSEVLTTGVTYDLATTTIPLVLLPGGHVKSATSVVGLPGDVTVSNTNALLAQNFTEIATNTFFFDYPNATQIGPLPVDVQFTANSGTQSFAIWRISDLERQISVAQDGAVIVNDMVTISNGDKSDLSTVQLSLPTTTSVYISQGLIHPSPYTLATGIVTLPSPVPSGGVSTVDISYTLPSRDISQVQGGQRLDLGNTGVYYPAFWGNYTVTTALPAGAKVQFVTQSTFSNVTVPPDVVLVVSVPSWWTLEPAVPTAFGVALFVVLFVLLYAYRNRGGPEVEVEAVWKDKRRVIHGLLEDIRLRGEGFAPYAYFTDERKSLEEERGRIASKINTLRERAKKEKDYRGPVDLLSNEDARLEQLYREARQALEDKLAGRLQEKEFSQKLEGLLKQCSRGVSFTLKKPQ